MNLDPVVLQGFVAEYTALKAKMEKNKEANKVRWKEWYETHKEEHSRKVREAERIRRAKKRAERDAAKLTQEHTPVISV